MKKYSPFFTLLVCTILSCNNSKNEKDRDPLSKEADSLYHEVMDGHNIGMAKMGRLTRAEQTTRRMLDSIQKLPARARQSAEPLRVKLDSLQKDLSYAEFAMNKWMDEINWDSALNNMEQRIDYLKSEKLKVLKVKEAILDGLQQADSVLHKKF